MRKGSAGMPRRGGEIRKQSKSSKNEKSPAMSRSEEGSDVSEAASRGPPRQSSEGSSPPKEEKNAPSPPKKDGKSPSKNDQKRSPSKLDDEKAAAEAEQKKIAEMISNLHQGDATKLKDALETFVKEMTTKYFPDSLKDWSLTVGSVLAPYIQQGEKTVALLAAKAAALMCVQLGDFDDEDVVNVYTKYFRPALLAVLVDQSADNLLRASCAEAIGIGELFAIKDSTLTQTTLSELLSLAFNKREDTSSVPILVQIAALRAWSLLITGSPSVLANSDYETRFLELQDLIEKSNAELRVTSGKALVLLSELAGRIGLELKPTSEMYETFEKLVKDTQADPQSEQKKTFREILKTFKFEEAPSWKRSVKTETLYIDSWEKRIQYNALFRILGTGTDNHLQNNSHIRKMFNLGNGLL